MKRFTDFANNPVVTVILYSWFIALAVHYGGNFWGFLGGAFCVILSLEAIEYELGAARQ